jgi:hypothetical protein
MSDRDRPHATEPHAELGCLVRLFWMAFGNLALLAAWMQVMASERIGTPDALYVGVVLALLLARYVDITRLNGMTIHTERATRADLRRYVVALSVLALLGWLVARLLSQGD